MGSRVLSYRFQVTVSRNLSLIVYHLELPLPRNLILVTYYIVIQIYAS